MSNCNDLLVKPGIIAECIGVWCQTAHSSKKAASPVMMAQVRHLYVVDYVRNPAKNTSHLVDYVRNPAKNTSHL